jgi:hypothetical protein
MRDLESLTAAMTLVPLLFSRNRMFALFGDPIVKRAQRRARSVRALLRFVSRADVEIDVTSSGDRVRIAYRIPRLRLSRVVQLGEFELVLLRVLLARTSTACPAALAEKPDDRARVDEAIARLPRDEAKSA